MNNKMDINKILFFLVIFIVVLVSIYFLFFSNKDSDKTSNKAVVQEDVIPTVDASVKVSLDKVVSDVVLSVKGIPGNTDKLEYELSYETAEQGLQGIGPSSVDKTIFKNDSYEKKITLGTCSSGRCVYHKVVGKIKLQIRFTGNYGDKIFENDFSI